jgi:hypothetical protein
MYLFEVAEVVFEFFDGFGDCVLVERVDKAVEAKDFI